MSENKQDQFIYVIQSLNRREIEKAIKIGIKINHILPNGETYFTLLSNSSKYSFNYSDYQTEEQKKLLDLEELEIIEIMKLLIQYGADINLHDTEIGCLSVNALWLATVTGKIEMVNFLLINGANPNINYNPTEDPDIISSVLDIAYAEATLNIYGNAENYEQIILNLEKHGAIISK